jgi:hypothetical protein
MTSIFDSDQDGSSIGVFVDKVTGTEIASKLSGYFVINGERTFRFRAIGFGRIGGHNISLSISKRTIDALKKMQIDPEWVVLKIQRKLIEGDITVMDPHET